MNGKNGKNGFGNKSLLLHLSKIGNEQKDWMFSTELCFYLQCK